MQIGDKVRVKDERRLTIASEYGGRTGVIEQAEPQVDEFLPEGAMAYEVRLDPKKANDVERRWFNDYELEAVLSG